VGQILLNVEGGDLHTALEECVSSAIEGRPGVRRTIWYQTLPTALCFLLQRAEYDRAKKQLIKKNTRFALDRTICLDRYLEANRADATVRRAELGRHRAEKKRVDTILNAYQNFQGVALDAALQGMPHTPTAPRAVCWLALCSIRMCLICCAVL
jgi:hypothetical protein